MDDNNDPTNGDGEFYAGMPPAEPTEPDYPTILIVIKPDGFETHVDNRLAPPTVAGAAWLLEKMAGMALMSTLQQQAQQQQQPSNLIVLAGHRPKRRGN